METFPVFMSTLYIKQADARLPVKVIYEDFRAWIIEKGGIELWNTITQRQVYSALKSLPEYNYVRFKEGYCLKGIIYKPSDSPKIFELRPELKKVPHFPTMILPVIGRK